MILSIPLGISTAYLLRDRRAILVDTGRPKDADRLRAAVEHAGVRMQDLALILHTHGHWDHAGSTRQIKSWSGAPVAIHGEDAELMVHGENGESQPIGLIAKFFLPLMNENYPGLEPDILVEDGMDLTTFGVRARIVHTPGHSPGSICILTEEGDAVAGDLLMGGYLGGWIWPSRPTYHYLAQDLNQIRASMRKLLDCNPKRIYLGHGGPVTPAAIRSRFAL